MPHDAGRAIGGRPRPNSLDACNQADASTSVKPRLEISDTGSQKACQFAQRFRPLTAKLERSQLFHRCSIEHRSTRTGEGKTTAPPAVVRTARRVPV